MRPTIILSKVIENKFKIKIRKVLIKNKINFYEIDKLPHFLSEEDSKRIPGDFFIVLGVHSLADKQKRISVHPAGNWSCIWPFPAFGAQGLGGKENTLCMSSGYLLRKIYLSILKNNNLKGYKSSIERTHHGPNISKPLVFFEVGCSPKEWEDMKPMVIIGKVLKDVLKNFKPSGKSCIVLGGDHYMENIAEIIESKKIQISHLCPSSRIPCFNDAILKEAIQKTYEPFDFVIIDLAGIGEEHPEIIKILEKNKINYKYLHDIK